MGGRSAVLAVVDHNEAGSVVWWVNLGASSGLTGRLCGAWVLGPTQSRQLSDLVSDRILLATEAGVEALEGRGMSHLARIDADATLAAVLNVRDALQAAFEEKSSTFRGRSLVAPTWPELPDLLDPENPPPVDAPDTVRRALSLARWFERLCRGWDGIEQQRLARNYLRPLGGEDRRELPLVLSDEAGTER